MWADGEEDRAELLLRAQHVKQIDDLKARHAVSAYVCVCVCVLYYDPLSTCGSCACTSPRTYIHT